MPSSRFARFLEVHPPDGPLAPCSADVIAPYRERVHEALIAFWTEVGWGWFGRGLLHVADPATLDDGLAIWLGRSDPTRIAIARTAFGEIFYYRDLREQARALGMSGTQPGELGDISHVDVHFQEISVAALDPNELFNDILCNPEHIEGHLRRGLVDFAREVYGPLTDRECFAFVPALALGGYEDPTCVQKVDMLVHWSILRQMA
jgi:hypothetical protein